MGLSDWYIEEKQPDNLPMELVRVMRISADIAEIPANIDPWTALTGLHLLADDKVYLHGALNALQLDRPYAYAFLMLYRQHWERAMKRCTNQNGLDNAGRRAANSWILDGASGFIIWE